MWICLDKGLSTSPCFVLIPHKRAAGLACSKRSDSGEWYEVKKAMKSRRGLGRDLPRFHFFALLFTSYCSPLSERLEQATARSKMDTGPRRIQV